MQAPKRQHATGVIEQLLNEPQRFRFSQLLNLLLRALRQQGIGYERALREVITFGNSLSLSFPASEVQSLRLESDSPDALAALRNGSVRRIHITPAFIGLLGANGTLPLHDTERIAARKAHGKDASQHELIDVLSNRLIGLFYEAWGKYRVEHGLDVRGQDKLLPMLTALAGARRQSALQGGRRVRPETAAYFAGLLRTRPVAAATVEQVLAAWFGLPIRLEQFVGSWDAIPDNRRSMLGSSTPGLACGAALGARQWRHDLVARLHIGPLDPAQVQGFLRGGASLAALEGLASLFATPTVRYEVRLLLAPACIERFVLGTKAAPRRLGWDTFLTDTPGVAARPEIHARLRLPDSAAAVTL